MTTAVETPGRIASEPVPGSGPARRSRLKWVALGGVAVVAAVATMALLRTADLPQDWSGKAAFCRTAQQFAIGNLGHGDEDPIALLKQLRQDAPPDLRSDVDKLIGAASQPPGGGEDPAKGASQRVGTFVETRCGVNLPGIVT